MALPNRGDELLVAARRSAGASRPLAARALLEAARAAGAGLTDADELDARLLIDAGRPLCAVLVAGGALERDPAHWPFRLLRAEAHLAGGDAASAAVDAADTVVAAPRDAAAKATLGSAMLALGHFADAAACLAESVVASPAHVGYRLAFARALACAGNVTGAQATLREGIILRPRALMLRVASIRLAVGADDFAEAVALADAACVDGVFDACILGLRGHALSCLGREEEAALSYRDALQLAPEDSYVRHLVAAAGLVAAPPRASEDYVRVLFDGFAEHFESDLIRLDYRVPGLIRQAVLAHLPCAATDTRPSLGAVLDLGCGTGLVGLLLSDLALGPFTGVDLSPGMLAQAASKMIYERLVAADIFKLALEPAGFRIAVAADVLPYLGDPQPVLAAVRPHLAPGGLLILTIETLDEPAAPAFRLRDQARFAHNPVAFCATAEASGFRIRECRRTILRQDRDRPVAGCLIVLELPSA